MTLLAHYVQHGPTGSALPPAPPAPSGARTARLPDGRLHLNHGPIDLILGFDGAVGECRRAEERAISVFADVLPVLVAELEHLKRPIGADLPPLRGPVASIMAHAVWPYRERFITPMAAVAGSVAQHVLAGALVGRHLRRAHANNGGDIALWLAPGETLALGVVSRLEVPTVDRRVILTAESGVRGVATSGWGGRSFSLGIADAVTIFASDASASDAAATVVANAVNVDHSGIHRVPACSIQPDSDLGGLLVTTGVDLEDPQATAEALDAGAAEAARWVREGTIRGALLYCGGHERAIGWTGA